MRGVALVVAEGPRVTTDSRSEGAAAFEEPIHVQMAQLGADVVGGGGDEAAHLIERLGPGLAGRDACYSQNPHRLHVSVPRLGLAVGLAGLRAARRGDGVLRIALAASASTLAIGTVHLDDSHRLSV